MKDLVTRLQRDLTDSMKSKDRPRTSVIRMLLAEVKTAETAAASQKRSAEETVAAYSKYCGKPWRNTSGVCDKFSWHNPHPQRDRPSGERQRPVLGHPVREPARPLACARGSDFPVREGTLE